MVPSSDETRIPDNDKTAMPAGVVTGGAAAAAPIAGEAMLALPAGTQLHEFEITGVIGEGGFGIVYAARDHSLDRAVALKEYMPGALATRTQSATVSVRSDRHRETFELGLKSFVNEARLLARFDHPSLVKVFRFWEAHGTAYMAMPHYHGETFKSRLKQLGAAPDEAWLRKLLSSLLEALEVIHAENVFHRDIAPDNIMLLDEDVPVLLDFGAARRVIGDATQGLTVILKPGYAPIEQYAEVKSMKQGAWTDLYALAATMHFAITGKPPEPAVARMLNDTMVPMVESGRGRYSEGFLAAMDAALRVKPEERPQNVAALRALLSGTPGQAKPPRADAASTRSSRTPLLAGGAVLIAALAIGGYLYLGQDKTPGGTAPPDQPVAQQTPPPPESAAKAPDTAPEPQAAAEKPPAAVTPAPPVTPPPPAETAAVPAVVPSPPAVVPKPPTVVAKPPQPAPDAKVAAIERKKDRADQPPATPTPPVTVPSPPLDQEAYRQPAPPRDTVEVPTQVRGLVAQAQQSLSRREFRRAIGLAENVLALDPSNLQARDIRRRAQEGEKRAFEEIKIE